MIEDDEQRCGMFAFVLTATATATVMLAIGYGIVQLGRFIGWLLGELGI